MLAENRLTRTYQLSRQLLEGARDAGGLRPGRPELSGRRVVHLHRVAAAGGADARRVPVRRQDRLLPAVLGRDGAADAHGRHPGARRHGLLDRRDGHQDRRVRRARLRRPLVGRGLLPELGLDHVRPDPRRVAGPQPARRRRVERQPHRRRRCPGSATRSPSAAPASPSRPLRSRGGTGRSASWRSWPWSGCWSLAWRRWRRGAPPALTELERALRRTRRVPAPGTTLHALELRFSSTPAAAGYVRALRESRYGDHPTPPDPRPAPRPAVRARTRQPACSVICVPGGRCPLDSVALRAYNRADGRCL